MEASAFSPAFCLQGSGSAFVLLLAVAGGNAVACAAAVATIEVRIQATAAHSAMLLIYTSKVVWPMAQGLPELEVLLPLSLCASCVVQFQCIKYFM
jgi:hypothetical protein